MAQSSIGAGLGFLTTVSQRVIEGAKSANAFDVLDALPEDTIREESDRFTRSLILRGRPEPVTEWYSITSNHTSAVEAIEATKCPVKWGQAKTPDKIPMITQPVAGRVKPVPLGRQMTNAEVYAQYGPRLVDPNRLFTFGANHPAFQTKKLVLTLWMYNGQLWCACLDVHGDDRIVRVGPDSPDNVWGADDCVLVCE